jgi:hypothetical protein
MSETLKKILAKLPAEKHEETVEYYRTFPWYTIIGNHPVFAYVSEIVSGDEVDKRRAELESYGYELTIERV